ncbi:hypothetical protein ES332_D05G147100v1 [Gossypium tomentosum]|uniref:Uncharacterized protein n=1 Tax=Gossypium tomentosum TaxID=34277 RepID=A0A5D2KYH1_GOSTO|nr:hypothetical protein ES332_D05G147100v1 [Gossypium tomentosum]
MSWVCHRVIQSTSSYHAWNSLMDQMMKELHSKGTRIEDIAAVLKRSPIHPRIVEAIKSAHALGCDLKNVSDANTFFIETILEHHGLKECFLEINTNPGFVDQQGKLRIFPHHDFTKSSHGCQHPSCLPNMCKDPSISIYGGPKENKNLPWLWAW